MIIKKIIVDEIIPLDPKGLAGDEPIDAEKECRLQIRSRAVPITGDPLLERFEELVWEKLNEVRLPIISRVIQYIRRLRYGPRQLPIVSKAIEGDDPIDLEEEHLGYPEHRLIFRHLPCSTKEWRKRQRSAKGKEIKPRPWS